MKLAKCPNESCRIPKSTRLSVVLKIKKSPKKQSEKLSKKLKKVAKVQEEKAHQQQQCIVPEEDAIFGLNDDCFEKIFRYLNMDDLINLVEASPQFQPNACTVFRLLYPRKLIRVSVRPDNIFIMRLTCVNLFRKYTLPEMQEFLRNFGAAISVLEIENGPFNSNLLIPLLNAICKHCVNTLTYLRISKLSFTPEILSSLQPLGPTLNRLELVDCNLNKTSELFQQFTNLANLKLHQISFDPKCIQQAFPNLREFIAFNLWAIKDQHMIEFIHRNPQLTMLSINHCKNITQNVFQTITNHLPLLKELAVNMRKGNCDGQFQQYPLNLPRLEKIKLQGFVHLDDYLHEMTSISQMKSIGIYNIQDNEQISRAINRFANYQHLTHLHFSSCSINSEHLEQISRSIPKLAQLDLDLEVEPTVDFDFNAIIRLVNGCKQLVVLKIRTPKVRMLHFDCEILHKLVDVIEQRTEESTKKVTIYGRDGLYVKFPVDHLTVYRNRLKIES